MGQDQNILIAPQAQWPESETAGLIGDGRNASRSLQPASVKELSEIVADAASRRSPLYPQGGRTAIDYGGLPARPGDIVSTTSLQGVLEYPAADMTITVESGMTLGTLQSILAEHNQYLPIDPPQGDQATVGGIIATGWSGPRSFSAMRPRDQLIGVGFVNGSGTLVKGGGRVVKNVAGYDFPKLLTGSVGSLGVITELTFKVRPRPESTAIAWVTCPGFSEAATLLDTLNLSATRPTAIELLNRRGASAIAGSLGLNSAEVVVAIGFDDSAKTVAWQSDAILKELPPGAAAEIRRDAEAAPIWKALAENKALEGCGLQARVVTRPGNLAGFLSGLDANAWSIQAHGGLGIATLGLADELTLEQVTSLVDHWTAILSDQGGSVTLPVCPSAWKNSLKVWGTHRPDWSIMAGIKTALDPHHILNPGRFLDMGR